MDFAGEFETHLTVRLGTLARLPQLQAWAAARQMKCLHIVLPRGEVRSQPMLSWRGRGSLPQQVERANRQVAELAADGFASCRVKIEAAPWNEDVPFEDHEATNPAHYFEHHLKLAVDPGDDLNDLAALALRHGAHLSRNALKDGQSGRQTRFLTQRCWCQGRRSADRALSELGNQVMRLGYLVAKSEQEFVVYDDNLPIDRGWL